MTVAPETSLGPQRQRGADTRNCPLSNLAIPWIQPCHTVSPAVKHSAFETSSPSARGEGLRPPVPPSITTHIHRDRRGKNSLARAAGKKTCFHRRGRVSIQKKRLFLYERKLRFSTWSFTSVFFRQVQEKTLWASPGPRPETKTTLHLFI